MMNNAIVVLFVAVFVACTVEASRAPDHPHHGMGHRNHIRYQGRSRGQGRVLHDLLHGSHSNEGPCPSVCTMEYMPVCGSDGVTYGNLCQLRSRACIVRMRLFVVKQGRCVQDRAM